jgi:hypothetical protein
MRKNSLAGSSGRYVTMVLTKSKERKRHAFTSSNEDDCCVSKKYQLRPIELRWCCGVGLYSYRFEVIPSCGETIHGLCAIRKSASKVSYTEGAVLTSLPVLQPWHSTVTRRVTRSTDPWKLVLQVGDNSRIYVNSPQGYNCVRPGTVPDDVVFNNKSTRARQTLTSLPRIRWTDQYIQQMQCNTVHSCSHRALGTLKPIE